MMKRYFVTWMALAALGLPLAMGCSEAGEDRNEWNPPEGDEGGFGGGGAGQPDTGGGGDVGPNVCPDATGVYEGEPAQTNLLFLLDRSGSMHLRVDETETRWTMTTAGLAEILDAIPGETKAGLAMFPSGDQPISCCVITSQNYIDCGACAPGELPEPEMRCDDTTYNTLAVGMAPLSDAHAQSITSAVSFSDEEFYWGTPLAPALTGTLDGVGGLALQGVTSVVLLTDGLPTSCHTVNDPEANDIQHALDAAVTGVQNGVRTYVVGIDAEAASTDPASDLAINLSLLAGAGDTARYQGCEQFDDCAYVVNADNFEQALGAALEEIALDAMSCAFDLPSVAGGLPDYDAVNITVDTEGQTSTIPRDMSHVDGWDYLPGFQQAQLYGPWCELLKSNADAKVQIVVGCKTLEA